MELERTRPLDESVAEDASGVSSVLRRLSTSASDKELATAEVLLRTFNESWRLERWLALGTFLMGIAATIVTTIAVAGDVPVVRRIVELTFYGQTYLQAAGLVISFGWLVYAWYNYRRMMHAKAMMLKSELIDLWLMSRRNSDT